MGNLDQSVRLKPKDSSYPHESELGLSGILENISGFSTEGFSEYDVDVYKKYIQENSIDMSRVLDKAVREMLQGSDHNMLNADSVYRALDAYANNDPENAGNFLRVVLDLEINTDDEFLYKKAWIDLLNYYAFNRLTSIGVSSQVEYSDDPIYTEVEASMNRGEGSVFLNAYLRHAMRRLLSLDDIVQEDDMFLGYPQESGGQFYFDTGSRNNNVSASFWAALDHSNDPHAHRGVYISQPEDYDAIHNIVAADQSAGHPTLSQESYEALQSYFYLAIPEKEITEGEDSAVDKDDYYLSLKENVALEVFRVLDQPFFQSYIKNELGLPLDDLSLPARIELLVYLKDNDVVSLEKVQKNTEQFGADFLASFLSLAHGGSEMSKVIFGIAEKVNKEEAKAIFAKYGEIIRLSEQLPEHYNAETHAFVYSRAVDLLKRTSEKSDEVNDQIISFFKAKLVALGAYYKEVRAREGKEAMREEIHFEMLSEEDLKKYGEYMADVTMENRKAFIVSQGDRQIRRKRFIESLGNPGTAFYAYRDDEGAPVAFTSFTQQEDGRLLVESLNITPVLKHGTGMGSDFFARVTKVLGQEKEIIGYVHEGNQSTLSYYQSIGYEALNIIEKDGTRYVPILYKGSQTGSREVQTAPVE